MMLRSLARGSQIATTFGCAVRAVRSVHAVRAVRAVPRPPTPLCAGQRYQAPAPAPPPPYARNPLKFRDILFGFLLAVKFSGACYVVLAFFIGISPTEGPSMMPTLQLTGEWLLIDKRFRLGRGIRVGDMVVYESPIVQDDLGIKRVLGLPGDYVVLSPIDMVPKKDNPMIHVPEGHCWLAGDNLAVSRDSRTYGPLPLALVKGKVIARVLPWIEAKWFDNGLEPV